MAVLALNDDTLLPQAKSNAKVVYNLSTTLLDTKSIHFHFTATFCFSKNLHFQVSDDISNIGGIGVQEFLSEPKLAIEWLTAPQ